MKNTHKNANLFDGIFHSRKWPRTLGILVAIFACLWLVGCGAESDESWSTETSTHALEVDGFDGAPEAR